MHTCTCTSMHTTHTITHTPTHIVHVSHIHTYHTKLPHYNSKQCSVANVHAHMQPNAHQQPPHKHVYQSSFRMARTACCCLVRRAIKTLSMNCSQMIMWMGMLWTMWGINLFIAIVSLSTVSLFVSHTCRMVVVLYTWHVKVVMP